MKKLFEKLLRLFVAAAVVFVSCGSAVTALADNGEVPAAIQYESSPFEGKGMFINCFDNADFPMKSPFVALSPEEQLEMMLDFAEKYGYTTIYFEALAYSNAMYRSSLLPISPGVKDGDGNVMIDNPLKTLTELCGERGLRLVAVLNPFYVGQKGQLLNEDRIFAARNEDYTVTTPDGGIYYDLLNDNVKEHIKRIVEELVKRYDIDGILLEGIDLPVQAKDCMGVGVDAAVVSLLEELRGVLDKNERGVLLGLSLDADYTDEAYSANADNWLAGGYADCLMLSSSLSATDDGQLFTDNLVYWKTAAEVTHTTFVMRLSAENMRIPTTSADRLAADDELFFELYAGELGDVENKAFSGYTALAADGELISRKLSSYSTSAYPLIKSELAISKTLAVTRPAEKLKWNGKKYFIMGTSDPSLPLYFHGEELERQGDKGVFGVLVDVEIGSNTYTFTQNGRSVSVEIEREDPNQSATHISSITQSSVFPQVSRGIRAGETIKLSCIAPSNGYVTATVNGVTVELEQVAATAEGGIPAVFSAEYTVPEDSCPAKKTLNAGAIVYRLSFNGEKTKAESPGELIIVGTDADFVIRTTDYNGNVYYDTEVTNEFVTTLRRGTLDYVVSCTDDGYYELASGGYLPVKSAEVVENGASPENVISDYSVEFGSRAELIKLTGTAGAPYHAELSDGVLGVTLYNTYGLEGLDLSASTLIESASVSYNEEENSTTISLRLKEDARLWGYSVEFDMNNSAELETDADKLDVKRTLIYLSKAPKLSYDRLRPLDGIVVMLDAGHGGTDPGALGFGGADGPTEAQLNYASVLYTKVRLEQLGATVLTLEQPEDDKLTLEQRLSASMDAKPDIFISLHHNSSGETVDSNDVSGTAVYYHFPGSASLAEYLTDYISGALNRENNGAHEGYFYVTRMSNQPSALVELSFMVNPAEYEDTCEPLSLYKTAYAIADSIVAAIRSF